MVNQNAMRRPAMGVESAIASRRGSRIGIMSRMAHPRTVSATGWRSGGRSARSRRGGRSDRGGRRRGRDLEPHLRPGLDLAVRRGALADDDVGARGGRGRSRRSTRRPSRRASAIASEAVMFWKSGMATGSDRVAGATNSAFGWGTAVVVVGTADAGSSSGVAGVPSSAVLHVPRPDLGGVGAAVHRDPGVRPAHRDQLHASRCRCHGARRNRPTPPWRAAGCTRRTRRRCCCCADPVLPAAGRPMSADGAGAAGDDTLERGGDLRDGRRGDGPRLGVLVLVDHRAVGSGDLRDAAPAARRTPSLENVE